MIALVRKSETPHPGTVGLMTWIEPDDGSIGVLVENWTGLYRVWFNDSKLIEVQNATGTVITSGTRHDRAVAAARDYIATSGGSASAG